MKVIQKDQYKFLSSEETSFEIFLNNFEKKYENLKDSHIVLEISSKNNFTEQNILLFLKYADIQKENGMSFVVINKGVEVDNFPENFNIVPTLIEAEDVIEMEDIQRDLGF
ncbi:hypothetical protein SAMN04489761_0531 [Tenacibaculum sp. MAR_2009_124]|uniref:hypothetical protein n=1 Tax=Tenacibaculum sp. MAR_2009_124 TaxID=1250059 RepID=UPI00089D2096|nr:hypothetical protein [Tenacibaculum sp. MAR_2009_124]SEB40946.1 hypothetical protein SAMN04489761_0531 [Tenacibaculum sp. MAR_2009_124]